MGAIDGVELLLRAAEVAQNRKHERVSNICNLMEEMGGQTALVNGLRIATVEVEIAVVGIFSLFEARMQSQVREGSFYTQLQKLLTNAGKDELAERVRLYYLAVNVLKHGRGGSYNKLLEAPNHPFVVKQPDQAFFDEGDISESEGLIDILDPNFFTGLIGTLKEVYEFLKA